MSADGQDARQAGGEQRLFRAGRHRHQQVWYSYTQACYFAAAAALAYSLGHRWKVLRIRAENMEPASERERLVATVEEMHTTLEDILVLARTGRAREELRRMDVGALADALVEEYRDRGEDVTSEGENGQVADVRPNLLRRAARNLVGNALAYGLRAGVRTMATDDEVRIEIEDDGPGIAEHQFEDVVQPFKRLEQSRSRTTGGAGLGLTIAQAIALAHGGALHLRNGEKGLIASIAIPTGAADSRRS